MNAPDTASALSRDLPLSLAVHPQRVDLLRDQVLFARLSPAAFLEASFLDQRVLGRGIETEWLGWDALAERMPHPPNGQQAHYVFHIGHCGSTLVSRLLAAVDVVPLREPLPLRTLAEVRADLAAPECRWSAATYESRLMLIKALFDRGRGPRAVKATSFCNDLAPDLLGTDTERRATIVYTQLRPYLANILAGPNSRLDVASMAPMRLKRLRTRIGSDIGRLHDMSPGQVAAMSWAAETASLAATVDAIDGGRLRLLDFDLMLRDVPAALRPLVDHVVPGVPDALIETTATGPILRTYSKAPEHAYDSRLRQEVLAQGECLFADEIRAGLTWSEHAASRSAAIARALELFNTG